VDIYFLGKYCWLIGLTSSVRVPSVNALGDRQVEASEQLSHSLSFTAKQHAHSLAAVMGNRHAPDRAHIAQGDLATLHELPDVWQALV
jgi:hypothetical protein